jgi:hypothetical protein
MDLRCRLDRGAGVPFTTVQRRGPGAAKWHGAVGSGDAGEDVGGLLTIFGDAFLPTRQRSISLSIFYVVRRFFEVWVSLFSGILGIGG